MPRRRDTQQPLAVQLFADGDTGLPPLFPADTNDQIVLHDKVYNLCALALRAYILTWYSRFSPRDRALLPAINRDILVPLLGPILADLHSDSAPLADLILLHVPTLAATHLQVYWAARAAVTLAGDDDLPTAYHARAPLLITERVNDTYVLSPRYCSALVESFLALRLSPSEYAADAERLVVREVVARAVLVSVGRRLAQPWFYAQIVLKLLGQPGTPRRGKSIGDQPPPCPPHKGWQRGVHIALRTYRTLVTVITVLWSGLTWLIATLSACPPASPKHNRVMDPWLAAAAAWLGTDGRAGLARPSWPVRTAWGCVEIVTALLAPILDRLLPCLLEQHLNAKLGIKVVDLLERILFPNGYPGPPPVDPTPDEAKALDSALRQRVDELVPRRLKLCVTPVDGDSADALVDPFSNAGCNAHLVGTLYNAVVATLLPELVQGDAPATTSGKATPPVEAAPPYSVSDEKASVEENKVDEKTSARDEKVQEKA